MELTTIFMVAVGVVCLCHIAFSIDQFLLGKGVRREVRTPAKCDEWYCFFKLEDLLGRKSVERRTDRQQLDKRSRRQQRPRMQA